jgi:hypothetical protein
MGIRHLLLVSLALWSVSAFPAVLTYGDQDVLGTGAYGSDPTAGATLEGLAADVVTFGAPPVGHGFPFTPGPGEFPGTDQIFVSLGQTTVGDGYSNSPERTSGPQLLTLDYSALVPQGQAVQTLTLGIAADDFQFVTLGQPYVATINGSNAAVLTNTLNSLSQTGPVVQFFTIGISPTLLSPTHVLTLVIDQQGNGRDGWAVDYLTVGVTSTPVPEPGGLAMMTAALLCLVALYRKARS